MNERSERRDEEAHDILAADEFGIGTRDDRYPGDPTGNERAHDVLAAEEFPMPTRDQRYADPSGIHEPHDVLAAEEFAMPGGSATQGSSPDGPGVRALLPLALVVLAALLVLRRRA